MQSASKIHKIFVASGWCILKSVDASRIHFRLTGEVEKKISKTALYNNFL